MMCFLFGYTLVHSIGSKDVDAHETEYILFLNNLKGFVFKG